MTTARPAAAPLRTELAIGGMTCGHCVGHVETALTQISGVSADVHLDAGTATVTHPPTVAIQALLDAVEEAGYEVTVRG
jgi:Cu+-exporting ATPase